MGPLGIRYIESRSFILIFPHIIFKSSIISYCRPNIPVFRMGRYCLAGGGVLFTLVEFDLDALGVPSNTLLQVL